MRSVTFHLLLTVWLTLGGAGLAVAIGGAADVASGEDDENLFRLVRQAVTADDEAALYALARRDPWGFREVTNQLGDLVAEQGGNGSAAEAFTRLVVAGHLGAIYQQVTGDSSLAARLRVMMDWTGYDMGDRARVDELLARVEAPDPPAPQALEEGLAVCGRLGDQRCLGLVRAGIGRLHERAARPEQAVLWYERSVDAFRQAGELVRLRNALLSTGQTLLDLGRAAAATGPLGSAASVCEQISDQPGRAGSLLILAEALAASGEREQAFTALGEARRIAFDRDLPMLAGRAVLLRAVLRDQNATGPVSPADYLTAARLAQSAGDLPTVVRAYSRATTLLMESGNTSQAAEILERALSAARLAHLDVEIPGLSLLAAELDSALGDFDRAIRRLQEALAQARTRQAPTEEARILELLGTTLLEAGRTDAAVGTLRQARDLARREAAVAIEGRAEGTLGAAELARGDLEAARQHYRRSAVLLQQAGDEFQSVRMRKMAEQLVSPSATAPGP